MREPGLTRGPVSGRAAGRPVGQRRFRIVSPGGTAVVAAIFGAAYLALHALGLRENVSLVFATSSGGSEGQLTWGVIYAVSYLGAVVLAPVLLLAAMIQYGILKLLRRPRGRRNREHT